MISIWRFLDKRMMKMMTTTTATSTPHTKRLRKGDFLAWIDAIDAFLFDCDGVLWRGDRPIEGAREAIKLLQLRGKDVIFVTNNATKSRSSYVQKLESHGIETTIENIFTSASTAASITKNEVFEGKVYVVGEAGLVEEVSAHGLECIGPEHNKLEGFPSAADIDRDIKAVIVGLDRSISYYKLAYSSICIRENPGCRFIATNSDATYPGDGLFYPGAGTLVKSIEVACGRAPDVCAGKPSRDLLKAIITEHGLIPSRTCMIGDRLNTDIEFGNNGGLRTLLVLSGITTEVELHEIENVLHRPEYYVDSIATIVEYANQE